MPVGVSSVLSSLAPLDLAVRRNRSISVPPSSSAHKFRPPAWAVRPSTGCALHVVERGEVRRTLRLDRGSSMYYVLGRCPRCACGGGDVVQVDHESVSRQHAAVVHGPNAVYLVDLDSAQGTFVNGARLLPYVPRVLENGNVLRLGSSSLNYLLRRYPTVEQISAAGAARAEKQQQQERRRAAAAIDGLPTPRGSSTAPAADESPMGTNARGSCPRTSANTLLNACAGLATWTDSAGSNTRAPQQWLPPCPSFAEAAAAAAWPEGRERSLSAPPPPLHRGGQPGHDRSPRPPPLVRRVSFSDADPVVIPPCCSDDAKHACAELIRAEEMRTAAAAAAAAVAVAKPPCVEDCGLCRGAVTPRTANKWVTTMEQRSEGGGVKRQQCDDSKDGDASSPLMMGSASKRPKIQPADAL